MNKYSKKMICGVVLLAVSTSVVVGATNKEEIVTIGRVSEKNNISLANKVKTSPDRIDEITATPYKIHMDKVVDMFLDDGKTSDGLVESEYPGNYFEDENGNMITVTEYGINYYSDFYFHILNSFRLDSRDIMYNADKYSTETDLDFMSMQDAANTVKSKLAEIGIDLGDIEYTCYALDYETMEQEEYAIDQNGNENISVYKDRWTQEDDCYYIVIRQKANNIVEYHDFYAYKNFVDSNAAIQAIVTAQGVKYLEMQYAFNLENTGKELEIIDEQQAMNYVTNKFEKNENADKYTIKSFRLCYRVDTENGNVVTPAYECLVEVENEIGITRHQLVIDAITGEEM